jgi:hypothetical protein
MLRMLQAIAERAAAENPYLGESLARQVRLEHAALALDAAPRVRWESLHRLAQAELYAGRFEVALAHQRQAYELTPRVADQLTDAQLQEALFGLALIHLRIGESANCLARRSPDSCILPLRGAGIHAHQAGSREAIRVFSELLERPRLDPDLEMEARWLLNIAYMTVGEYPEGVPPTHLIPSSVFASEVEFPEFREVAGELGLDTFGMSGGVIVDDLDGDDDLDILASDSHPAGQLRLWRNNADGTLTEVTEAAGLLGLYGGLNMVQADYDNDGDVDAYVLRGAWLGQGGRHPNSLLRNDGNLTFTDVTFESGLGQERWPTQAAAWADYDNDGDVDLFVATESTRYTPAPSLLYRNNNDGTFEEVSREAGVENRLYAKGAVWGDFDGDRWPDLYVSNLGGANRLYRNNREGTFTDVARELGVDGPRDSFPTWFWDFDNDGALDLLVATFPRSLADAARSYLGRPFESDVTRFYRGDGRGGFADVTERVGPRRVHDSMGANYGDLDGDGYLDFYLGTGFPLFHAIVPNAMYLNARGEGFADVTTAGRFGHLQKGHGIAFADLDQDGDQEVVAVMGGTVPGDEAHNTLWENPGFGNRWLTVDLVGTRSNRGAIGARIAVTFVEDGRQRTVFRHVTSGGSFGAGPLRQTIGLGRAGHIESVEVYWPTSDTTQTFTALPLDVAVEIVEGDPTPRRLALRPYRLAGTKSFSEAPGPAHHHGAAAVGTPISQDVVERSSSATRGMPARSGRISKSSNGEDAARRATSLAWRWPISIASHTPPGRPASSLSRREIVERPPAGEKSAAAGSWSTTSREISEASSGAM